MEIQISGMFDRLCYAILNNFQDFMIQQWLDWTHSTKKAK
jgi:hypothetical protein